MTKSQTCLPDRQVPYPKSQQCVLRTLIHKCCPVLAGHFVWIWTLGFWIYFICVVAFADPFLESVLKDGIGARPIGMGGAFVALSDDSNAVFYNPAALASLGTSYIREYMDMNTDFNVVHEGYTLSTNQGGMAYWTRLDKKSKQAAVTSFAFGTGGDNGVSWGLNYKNVAWNSDTLNSDSNRGWSFDAGIKAPLLRELTGGVLLQDFFRNNLEVPASLRLGIAFFPALIRDASIAIDGEIRNLKSANGPTVFMHYGAETKLSDGLIVRGGWQKDRFSAGATAALPFANIDYAVIVNRDDKNLHMFSFRFKEKR